MLTGRRGSKPDEKPKGRKSLKDALAGGDCDFSLLRLRPCLYGLRCYGSSGRNDLVSEKPVVRPVQS